MGSGTNASRAKAMIFKDFASDPKHLGAEPGIIMVLHTWGQKLNPHYHVHCMVTGGGLTKDRNRWISSPNPNFCFLSMPLEKCRT